MNKYLKIKFKGGKNEAQLGHQLVPLKIGISCSQIKTYHTQFSSFKKPMDI